MFTGKPGCIIFSGQVPPRAARPRCRRAITSATHFLKFPVFILPRSLRPVLFTALLTLSLAAAPRAALAQTNIDTSYAIGLEHAMAEPYNFTGRIFDLDLVGFGSGTLIRRHTVLTAAHVVFDTTAGFIVNSTFTRGLYDNYSFSKSQVIKADALSGYVAAADASTEDSLAAFTRDMGYVLIMDAPPDGTWGSYLADPSTLADSSNQFFVLGYPGVTFDGRTMAYIVPSSTFTQVGSSTDSGLFENDGYSPEPGESGGPVYVYDGTSRNVVAETLGGIADSTGEFNATFVRAIDKQANQFLTQAEYTSGLIVKAKIKGPKTVTHGTTVTYNVMPRFLVPDVGGTGPATTDRYSELKLKTSTPGTSTQPAVTVKKISNTEFQVTFDKTIRPKSTTTLQAYYSKTAMVPNSKITITVE